MALTKKDRFRLKSRIIDALQPDFGDGWALAEINLLLGECGLTLLEPNYSGPTLPEIIAGVTDNTLLEMYGIVFDLEPDAIEVSSAPADEKGWKQGYLHVFLSHSAQHKAFVGQVAEELAVVGVDAFVAHDAMEISKPWQAQIEQALRSMTVFVAIVHPEFEDSAWCQQEVGWAMGRAVPRFAVRMGADPAGFLGSDQWPSAIGSDPKGVAGTIVDWIASLPELGDVLIDGLLAALGAAGNYVDAGATAERIAHLGSLSPERFARLDEVWWSNDQLYGGALPSRAMKPFYLANGRTWPPPRPKGPAALPEPF